MHVVTIDVWVGAGSGVHRQFRQILVLGQQRRRIDPHTGDAPVEPEPQDGLMLGAHLGVCPVEVGLLWCEQVQVPLVG